MHTRKKSDSINYNLGFVEKCGHKLSNDTAMPFKWLNPGIEKLWVQALIKQALFALAFRSQSAENPSTEHEFPQNWDTIDRENALVDGGPVTQWLTKRTTNWKVRGSNPVSLGAKDSFTIDIGQSVSWREFNAKQSIWRKQGNCFSSVKRFSHLKGELQSGGVFVRAHVLVPRVGALARRNEDADDAGPWQQGEGTLRSTAGIEVRGRLFE